MLSHFKKSKNKSEQTPSKPYWIASLNDITQYEWEQIEVNGELGLLSVDNYFHLCDLVSELLGQKSKVSSKCKGLIDYMKIIKNYILEPNNLSRQNDYEFARAKFLHDSEPKKHESISPFMFKAYGQIDKKNISVKEYLELYKALEKWQN